MSRSLILPRREKLIGSLQELHRDERGYGILNPFLVAPSGPTLPAQYWRILVTDTQATGSDSTAGLQELYLAASDFGANEATTPTNAISDSEFDGNFVNDNAFDGELSDNTGNGWASTNTAFPHYIGYDFGSGNDITIVGIAISGRAVTGASIEQGFEDFDVQYSNDGSIWATYWSEASVVWAKYSFKWFHHTAPSYSGSPHGAHSFWRIFVFETGGANTSASEIEFLDVSGGTDQATGGTAVADSVFSSFVAANAFDDNTGTFWAGGNAAGWMRYDFASAVEIGAVSWRARSDANPEQSIYYGVVQYADSSSGPWQTAWAIQTGGGWSTNEKRTFADPNYV
jgi:hypothetical protein